ncbi:hypothetical protein GCM10011487_70310 [Steroidobacter agaridevorans]|uniref:Lipase modulator n=2 Tax=Steroidobacter agaridevorans TaxID=2695856 RepID=A0A829YPU1_9GAMM|nr:hypothetical protein GCM10011487_70310 [Steroidobacter agaridevorans]GFE86889.1 hypothetical protein GCM10011488_18430 [Steroidobacter agaridevorans]
MSKAVILLSLSTLALASSTIYLMARAEPALRTATNEECPRDEPRAAELEEVPQKTSPADEPVPRPNALAPNASTHAGADTVAARLERAIAEPMTADRNLAIEVLFGVKQSQLLQDPKYRAASRELQKQIALEMYAERINALQLSPQMAGRLAQLLADHSLQWVEESAGRVTDKDRAEGSGDAPTVATLNQQSREQRQHAEIEALLGADKYREWIELERTKEARREVATLERTFESAGEQLRPDQRKALVKAIADERTRQRDTGTPPRGFGRAVASPESAEDNLRAHVAVLERDYKSIQASNERLARAAASALSAQQLSAYQATLDHRLARARAKIDLSRAALEFIGRTDLISQ